MLLSLISNYIEESVTTPDGAIGKDNVCDSFCASNNIKLTMLAMHFKSMIVLRRQRERLSLERLRAYNNGLDDEVTYRIPDPGVRNSSSVGEIAFTNRLASNTVKVTIQFEVSPRGYRLDTLRPPPLSAKLGDETGKMYGRLSFGAKIEFVKEHMRLENARLDMAIGRACDRVEALEREGEYIATEEVKCK